MTISSNSLSGKIVISIYLGVFFFPENFSCSSEMFFCLFIFLLLSIFVYIN